MANAKYQVGDQVRTMSGELVTITQATWIKDRWVYEYEIVERGSVSEPLISRLVKKAR